jgi:hypothetical protein
VDECFRQDPQGAVGESADEAPPASCQRAAVATVVIVFRVLTVLVSSLRNCNADDEATAMQMTFRSSLYSSLSTVSSEAAASLVLVSRW